MPVMHEGVGSPQGGGGSKADRGAAARDPDAEPAEAACRSVIEVEGLLFSYRGRDQPALRGLSFNVGAGEIFGFLGPSGSGKSTTQKVLIGILKPYRGSVSILGRDLRGQGSELYEQIGVGFELPNHYAKLTALENLRFFASFYSRPLRDLGELLARVGLREHADRRVDQLSKGMRMRLNFVRALMHDPEVLFLDEPTAGLDPANARLVKDLILEEKERGKSIFLTTHDMHDAEELCDRVAFLVDGEIRQMGAPSELCAEAAGGRVVVEYRQDGRQQRRDFPLSDLGRDSGFLALLNEREIVSIHSQEPTLEEVFLRTTGRRLQ